MKISVEYVAKLARLSVSESEKKLFGEQLSSILQYVEKLNELNTADIKSISHVISLSNVMRDDVQQGTISREDALMNAPDHTDEFYRVPKIIE